MSFIPSQCSQLLENVNDILDLVKNTSQKLLSAFARSLLLKNMIDSKK
jgi:hypothetical protein